MRYATFCSGIEAPSAAWHPLGWEPVLFSEIEPFPSAVLAYHYPNVPNVGDMNLFYEKLKHSNNLGKIDLVCAGTPCFAKGTLVLTHKGFIDISDVVVGDLVLTHKKRWCRVLATGNKISDTIEVKGQGAKIITTKSHKFYASKQSLVWNNNIRRYERSYPDPSWVEANCLGGHAWVVPSSDIEPLGVPAIQAEGNEKPFACDMKESFWYFIGLWLGNGWTRITNRRSYVLICAGKHKPIDEPLLNAGIKFNKSETRTSFRYQVSNSALAKWIKAQFGAGAGGKKIPGWVYTMPKSYRKALMDGYVYTDGTIVPNGFRTSSVSKSLSYGIGLLGSTLGFSYSVAEYGEGKITSVIEGRTVNTKKNYQVSFYHKSRSAFFRDGFMYGYIRTITATNKSEVVYDITVEEDHSYCANGVVVHNCQSFSLAGLRKGLDDPRGNLALVYLGIIERIKPTWVVWENVPGVLSSWSATGEKDENGEWEETNDFTTFITALGELGYGYAWRILDAQYFGVPQRRRRVFVVGYLGDWRRAAAVLFERESVSGNLTQSLGQKKAVAALTANGVGTCGADDTQAQSGHIVATFDSSFARLQGTPGQDLNHGHSHLVFGGGVPEPLRLSPALNAGAQGRQDFDTEAIIFDSRQSVTQQSVPGPLANTLDTDAGSLAVMVDFMNGNVDDVSQPLQAHDVSYSLNAMPTVFKSNLRRITPVEAERLQGFEDNYTLIPFRKKRAADGPRYKAIGNSMAKPVMEWIGQRIQMVQDLIENEK